MRLQSPWAVPLIALALASRLAAAAFVTTNQAEMSQIYGQPVFATTPIDVRFQPVVTIVAPGLLNITTLAELNALFGLSPVNAPGINMFFVDSVSVCNTPTPAPGIQGCATINGNDIVVESVAAADPLPLAGPVGSLSAGAALNAHELAHNLGLPHIPECAPSVPPNLMDCLLTGYELTAAQAATVLANSSVLQSDPSGLFVSITPILILPIPAPPALLLFGSALMLGWLSRRRAAH
ncbi:MAG: hypothetical protein D6727_07680 [Gammaproteobacteria bacterium]|nr:MAG: hypothetical protein D6727_07680 [Gammaproteobacteria bacterium]